MSITKLQSRSSLTAATDCVRLKILFCPVQKIQTSKSNGNGLLVNSLPLALLIDYTRIVLVSDGPSVVAIILESDGRPPPNLKKVISTICTILHAYTYTFARSAKCAYRCTKSVAHDP